MPLSTEAPLRLSDLVDRMCTEAASEAALATIAL